MTRKLVVALCLFCGSVPVFGADPDDLDDYKIRITALWWKFEPSGYVGATVLGRFDLKQDFGFTESTTFSGTLDWKFARKHHFLLTGMPTSISRTAVLPRTITFQGVTFPAGSTATASLEWTAIAPGYQYDIVRRNQGYVGIATQVFIMDPKASVTGSAVVGGQTLTRTASASHLVGLPVVGPRFRFYPVPRQGWLAFDGFIQGMYFGPYGDFWTGRGSVNVGIRHVKVAAGYQWGTRLRLQGGANDLGARLSEQGPVVGVEFSW